MDENETEGSGAGIFDEVEGMLSDLIEDDPAPEDEGEDAAPADEAPALDSDGIPQDPEELRKGFLRQADYTRKTQDLAKQRKEMDAQLAELTTLREQLHAAKGKLPAGKQEAPASEQPPADATAEQLLQFYVRQEVQKARAELDAEVASLKPAAQAQALTTSLIGAYRKILAGDDVDPVFGTQSAAEMVGKIIEDDEDLMDLAKSNPSRAIRLAMKTAQAELREARARKSNDAGKGAGLKPGGGKRAAPTIMDPLEAAGAALKEFRAQAAAE